MTGTNSYEDTANSDIVVIAGFRENRGMSRDELIAVNAKVVKMSVRMLKIFTEYPS